MSYPDIRGLLLDATFDHLEPLAIPRWAMPCKLPTPRMPASMAPLVSRAVTKFINLNVAEQVVRCPSPTSPSSPTSPPPRWRSTPARCGSCGGTGTR